MGPETKIIGFTIQNGNDGIAIEGKLDILNNRIINTVDGIDYKDRSNIVGGLVRNNVFENNSDDGIDLASNSELQSGSPAIYAGTAFFEWREETVLDSSSFNGDDGIDKEDLLFIRHLDDLDLNVKPQNLVVLPNGNLLVLESQPLRNSRSNEITTDEELVGSVALPASYNPINTDFYCRFKRLIGFTNSGNKLIEINRE